MNNIINKINFFECCEYHNDKEFFIKDQQNGMSILCNSFDYHVKITNKKNSVISFLKIDKCVFTDSDDERCDFCVASESKIYFVEIKELELFDDSSKSHIKKNKKRIEARKQLSNTINNFKKLYPTMKVENINAVIALKPKLEDSYIKIITTKVQNVIDEFMTTCGCPNIYEGNLIEFI